MLLSFKRSAAYNKKLNSPRTTLSVVKQLSSDIIRLNAGNCPTCGANIQGCTITLSSQKLKPSEVLYHSLLILLCNFDENRAKSYLLESEAVA